jgi:crotonobetainyl-CoA:carnitine CoA-transferase CaiB-like acyl-CoA transferase
MTTAEGATFLDGTRVLEIADERGEYAGRVLAGLGADVVKVEPPGGSTTRQYGPFLGDEPGPERSLYFWHYNVGKRSVVLDLETDEGRQALRRLCDEVEVVLDGTDAGYLAERGVAYEDVRQTNPGLIWARLTPFGDTGPWSTFKASDLVHLALGGIMHNCGYDAQPDGTYDTPPMAPQMWHAYHVGGEMAIMAVLAALRYRDKTGVGQELVTSIHDAVSKTTEGDMPSWVYNRQPYHRQTGRHAGFRPSANTNALTKDARFLAASGALPGSGDIFPGVLAFLNKFGMANDLNDERYADPSARTEPAVASHITAQLHNLASKFLFEAEVWRDAQAEGLMWAPLRRPEENLPDEHWAERETFMDVEHPELNRSFRYIGAKWYCEDVPWAGRVRAPLVGEHTTEVLGGLGGAPTRAQPAAGVASTPATTSVHGKPWALEGLKVVDLTWLLASAGGLRYLSALGAEVVRVEHASRLDFLRFGFTAPESKAIRDAATGPLEYPPPPSSLNRSGFFNEINAGRRSISLDIKSPEGRDILQQLLARADVVCEGFSPGTMDRLGLGWEVLKELNPRLVYVQQSGMGQHGVYGRLRSIGPIAQAFSGLTEMSGLPEYPPAGIGFSYLDWYGAYNMAVAILAGIRRRDGSGRGVWIDASQTEAGIFLTGTNVLDFQANGRATRRYGNRSPHKLAAPAGAFPCQGEDRWIAISCFTDDEWRGLVQVLGTPEWAAKPELSSLSDRVAHQRDLEALVGEATRTWDRYVLQDALQAAGVPAGVVQTAEDRYERDPQLAHLGWLVPLRHSEIGEWPVKEFPVRFSETPAYMGGLVDRHGPCYGEDTDFVLTSILGFAQSDVDKLRERGVV